jgi:hypothetical protein
MNCIKGLDRKLEPTAMHSEHPVMREDKDAGPDEQDQIVQTDTP